MMFEGEISDELLMIIYIFITMIAVYVILSIVFYTWNKKGKAYKTRKAKQTIREQYSTDLSAIETTNTDQTIHENRTQNPT